jgi:hypothetical protein
MTRPRSLHRYFSGALVCAMASLAASAADAEPLLFLDHSPVAPPPAVPALRPYLGGPALLYLVLDGATITKVSGGGSAPADTSPLCGATIAAFDHAPLGPSRTTVIVDLVKEVRALFAAYDLEVVTSRPAAPQYQMAVVGGAPAVCGFPTGYSGMAPLDCGDANPSDVLFVFSDGITSLKMLAIVIAHEAGHAYGLPHSTAPCDVMSNKLCDGPAGPLAKTFLDTSAAVTPDHKGKCGLSTTNSHRQLLTLLGPRAASGDAGLDAGLSDDGPRPAPSQGCAVGLSAERGSGLRWPGSLLLLVTLLILLNKRSRWCAATYRRKHTERWHGHPGRTDLGNR